MTTASGTAGIGDFSVNLDFYGIAGNLPANLKVGYTLKGVGSFQQGMMRLGNGDNFVGLRWIYLNLTSSFNFSSQNTGLTPRELTATRVLRGQ